MKRLLVVVVLIVACAGIAFSQSAPYFPPLPIYTWYYDDISLDSLQRPIDGTKGIRRVDFTENVLMAGKSSSLTSERTAGPGRLTPWDTSYIAFAGTNSYIYGEPFPQRFVGFLEDTTEHGDLALRYRSWYRFYGFAEPMGTPYGVFRLDTIAVSPSGSASKIRVVVSATRFPDRSVTVPKGTYTLCHFFVVTNQVGPVITIPFLGDAFFPVATATDSVWIADGEWIVRISSPSILVDLTSYGGGKTYIDGYISELRNAPLTAVNDASLGSRPSAILLLQAYPNPFNPSTALRFNLPAAGVVSLRVFDMLGREVADLWEGWKPEGMHEVRWEPAGLASGFYIARLEHAGRVVSRTISLLK